MLNSSFGAHECAEIRMEIELSRPSCDRVFGTQLLRHIIMRGGVMLEINEIFTFIAKKFFLVVASRVVE